MKIFCALLVGFGGLSLAQTPAEHADRCRQAFESTLKLADKGNNLLTTFYQDWKSNVGGKGTYQEWKQSLVNRYGDHLRNVPADCCPIPRRPQCGCDLVSTGGEQGFAAQLGGIDKSMKVCEIQEPEEPDPRLKALKGKASVCGQIAVEATWQSLFEARADNGWCEAFPEAGRCIPPRFAELVPSNQNPSCKKITGSQTKYEESVDEMAGSFVDLASYHAEIPTKNKNESSMPRMTGIRNNDEPARLSTEVGGMTHIDDAPSAGSRNENHQTARAEAPTAKSDSLRPVACGGSEQNNVRQFSSNRYYEVYVVEGEESWELAGKDTPKAKCKGMLLSNDSGSWVVRGEILGEVVDEDGNHLYSEIMGAMVLPKGAKRGLSPHRVEGGNLYWILPLGDGTTTYLKKTCSAQQKVIDAADNGLPLSTTFYVKPNPHPKPNQNEYEVVSLDYHFRGPKRGEFTVGYPSEVIDRVPGLAVAGGIQPVAYAPEAL